MTSSPYNPCSSVCECTGASLPVVAVGGDSWYTLLKRLDTSLEGLRHPREQRHLIRISELDPPPGYCTASWTLAPERLVREALQCFVAHTGQRVLYLAAHATVEARFSMTQRSWHERMDSRQLDLLFARDNRSPPRGPGRGEVCDQCFVVHCNDRTLRFFQEVFSSLMSQPRMSGYAQHSAQFYINRLLASERGEAPFHGAFGVRWDFMPDQDVAFDKLHGNVSRLPAVRLHDTGWQIEKTCSAKSSETSCDGAVAGRCQGHGFLSELDRLANEIIGVREEVAQSSFEIAAQMQPALAVAASELLAEVEGLAQQLFSCSPMCQNAMSSETSAASTVTAASAKVSSPFSFDTVD